MAKSLILLLAIALGVALLMYLQVHQGMTWDSMADAMDAWLFDGALLRWLALLIVLVAVPVVFNIVAYNIKTRQGRRS